MKATTVSLLVAAAVACVFAPWAAAEKAVLAPAPALDENAGGAATETAVFAGGCFWGVQGVFQRVAGVTSAVSGYAGGPADAAQYEKVGTGSTGHAEAVRVVFDPRKVSYGKLLQIHMSVAHDPTQLNRQGPDHGTQYRSALFPVSAEQARVAKAYVEQLNRANTFGQPLATTIEPQKAFYPAEAYHQDYLTLHPQQPYIAINDLPKIDELKRLFPAVYQAKPVLVGAADEKRQP